MIRALAHALREQHLAEGVVELVRAGVEQVLALEPDLRSRAGIAEPASVGHRRRPARELGEPAIELGRERRIGEGACHLGLELLERGHERLRHVGAAVAVEAAAGSRAHRGSTLSCAAAERAAITKPRTSSGSFSPGRRSRRLDASTPAGRTVAIASRRRPVQGRRRACTRGDGRRPRPTPGERGGRCRRGALPCSGMPSSITSVSGGQSMRARRAHVVDVEDRNDGNGAAVTRFAVEAPVHLHAGEPVARRGCIAVGGAGLDEDADQVRPVRRPPA